jgi:hypothetical protein
MRCLRPKWEPDNFSCSHRCTSDVRPWLGACPVLIAPARPALSCLPLGLVRSPSVLPFTPISCSLVRPQLGQIVFGPEPQSYTGNCLDGRGRNLSVPNPTMERAPVNSEQSCRFRNGVSSHNRMSHGVTFVKQKRHRRSTLYKNNLVSTETLSQLLAKSKAPERVSEYKGGHGFLLSYRVPAPVRLVGESRTALLTVSLI